MIRFHIKSIWQRVATLIENQASRQQLAELDEASLKDIGISRAQAAFEASRQPWDALPWAVVTSPTRDRSVPDFRSVSQKRC